MAPRVLEKIFTPIRVRTFGMFLAASLFTLVTAIAMGAERSPSAMQAGDWPAFGRDPGGSQHSPLTQIDKKNVRQLKRVWTHRSGDVIDAPAPNGTILQTTPLHVNDTLYFCTPLNRVFALDPRTGHERWVFDPHREGISPAPDRPMRCRGVAYWAQSTDALQQPCVRRIFRNGDSGRLYALDADTGKRCADFGKGKGHAGWVSHQDYENHGEGILAASTSPPAVIGDLVISAMMVNDGIANAKDGIVRAFDVRTGELRWEFNPIPPEYRLSLIHI